MKIALYHPWVYLKSGLERSLLELVKRSKHNWTIFTHHYDANGTYPELQLQEVVQLYPEISVKRSFAEVMRGSLQILKTKLPIDEFDVLVVSSEGVGDFINFRNHNKPIVSFCHTPLKIIHDYQSKQYYLSTHPGVYPKFLIFSNIFKMVDYLAWRYYSQIVANSSETKKRILNANLAHDVKITIIHPGADVENMKPTWEYQPYFLIPGRIMWQKNIQLGIEAFHLLKKQNPNVNYELIIAGMVDEKSKPYLEELKQLAKDEPSIKFVVGPTDQELFSLYQSSYAVLFTARNEDWGMVPLEAMAYGKPVLAVARGGPLESIVDKKTGYLLADDPNQFMQKMYYLIQNRNLVLKLGKNAHEYAREFNWDNFVSAFDKLLEEVC